MNLKNILIMLMACLGVCGAAVSLNSCQMSHYSGLETLYSSDGDREEEKQLWKYQEPYVVEVTTSAPRAWLCKGVFISYHTFVLPATCVVDIDPTGKTHPSEYSHLPISSIRYKNKDTGYPKQLDHTYVVDVSVYPDLFVFHGDLNHVVHNLAVVTLFDRKFSPDHPKDYSRDVVDVDKVQHSRAPQLYLTGGDLSDSPLRRLNIDTAYYDQITTKLSQLVAQSDELIAYLDALKELLHTQSYESQSVKVVLAKLKIDSLSEAASTSQLRFRVDRLIKREHSVLAFRVKRQRWMSDYVIFMKGHTHLGETVSSDQPICVQDHGSAVIEKTDSVNQIVGLVDQRLMVDLLSSRVSFGKESGIDYLYFFFATHQGKCASKAHVIYFDFYAKWLADQAAEGLLKIDAALRSNR